MMLAFHYVRKKVIVLDGQLFVALPSVCWMTLEVTTLVLPGHCFSFTDLVRLAY